MHMYDLPHHTLRLYTSASPFLLLLQEGLHALTDPFNMVTEQIGCGVTIAILERLKDGLMFFGSIFTVKQPNTGIQPRKVKMYV